ncbi:MAG TPA: M1 family metallopeptidase [Jatrophihabitans sp.]
MRGSRRFAASVLVILLTLSSAPAAAAVRFTPGSAGVGDPYFPQLGNGGYDAAHYTLDLRYQPATHLLAGTVRMQASATKNLSRFDLDLSGMTVRSVRVDGTVAHFSRVGQELRIVPAKGILRGADFVTAVRYDGSPKTIKGSPIVFGADYGWIYTNDGAFVGDEPNAAHTWFPVNDHPRDKARYTFRVTVPSNRQVVANGELASRHSSSGSTTFIWQERRPMASYLATIDIGRWVFRNGQTPRGIPEVMAYDPTRANGVRANKVFGKTAAITDYWAHLFGSYPFTSTGAIVDNVQHVGFSLETETRPLYGFAPDQYTVSHELAHEWFGDSVSVRTWRDIWLNEGFATFASWLWAEHTTGQNTRTTALQVYRNYGSANRFWRQSIADPKRNTMFSGAVYYRGAMTLAALRQRIGDNAFFKLLRTWVRTHRYGNATTQQFTQLAEQVSGLHLGHLFHVWLWRKAKPASTDRP